MFSHLCQSFVLKSCVCWCIKRWLSKSQFKLQRSVPDWKNICDNSASWDQHVNSVNGGLGIIVSQDRSGQVISTPHMHLFYILTLPVNRKISIKADLTSYRMITLDWTNLTFGDMIDPQYGFIYPTNEDIVNY